jgi:hypothetical protein
MKTKTITFVKEKDTKHMVRFVEKPKEGEPPVMNITIIENPANHAVIRITPTAIRQQGNAIAMGTVIDAHELTHKEWRKWHPRTMKLKSESKEKLAALIKELEDRKFHRLTTQAQRVFDSLKEV